jgi:hypothetical protein
MPPLPISPPTTIMTTISDAGETLDRRPQMGTALLSNLSASLDYPVPEPWLTEVSHRSPTVPVCSPRAISEKAVDRRPSEP